MFYETNTFPHWVFSQFLEDWNMQKLRTKESRHIKKYIIEIINSKCKIFEIHCDISTVLHVICRCCWWLVHFVLSSPESTQNLQEALSATWRGLFPFYHCVWLASHPSWPEPHRVLDYICVIRNSVGKTPDPEIQTSWAAIKATWASASRQLCCRLTVSMPRYNHAVIHGKEALARCWGYKWAAWDTGVNELWAKIIEIKAKKLWTIWKFTFFELTESNINQYKETKKSKNILHI